MKIGIKNLFVKITSGRSDIIGIVAKVIFVKFSIIIKKSIKLIPRIKISKSGLNIEWMFLKTGVSFRG